MSWVERIADEVAGCSPTPAQRRPIDPSGPAKLHFVAAVSVGDRHRHRTQWARASLSQPPLVGRRRRPRPPSATRGRRASPIQQVAGRAAAATSPAGLRPTHLRGPSSSALGRHAPASTPRNGPRERERRSSLAAIIVSAEDASDSDASPAVSPPAPNVAVMFVFGPAPAPLAMLLSPPQRLLCTLAVRRRPGIDPRLARRYRSNLSAGSVDFDPYSFL